MKFALPNFDVLNDFSGYIDGVKLSIPGNQWFVANHFIPYFHTKGINLYVETLPAVMVRRRANGYPISVGNLKLNFTPEIVCINKDFTKNIKIKDKFDFVSDDMALIYKEKKLDNICDIKNYKSGIPNPRTSSLGIKFKKMYEKNCEYFGNLKNKVFLSNVHYRELPSMFLNNEIDYAIMWKSEALYWRFKHFPIKDESVFSMLLLNNAGEEAEKVFNEFKSENISKFYKKYGFKLLI